jgi:hypothetical protein
MVDGTRLRIDLLHVHGARYCSHKHGLLFPCRMPACRKAMVSCSYRLLRSAHMRSQRTNLRQSPRHVRARCDVSIHHQLHLQIQTVARIHIHFRLILSQSLLVVMSDASSSFHHHSTRSWHFAHVPSHLHQHNVRWSDSPTDVWFYGRTHFGTASLHVLAFNTTDESKKTGQCLQ